MDTVDDESIGEMLRRLNDAALAALRKAPETPPEPLHRVGPGGKPFCYILEATKLRTGSVSFQWAEVPREVMSADEGFNCPDCNKAALKLIEAGIPYVR